MKQYMIQELTKTIGEKTLFESLQFTIQTNDKVGLIGQNGTGKTTLLSILAGRTLADSFEYDRPNDYTIAYLEQSEALDLEQTVIETVFAHDAPLLQLNLAYEKAAEQLAKESHNTALLEQFQRLQQQMDEQDGWSVNTEARTILTKLGIPFFERPMKELSGGQQKRVALAKTLLQPADLYLLDEPTNHLDVDSIEWLQHYLKELQAAVLFITHDRYFLDEVTNEIYELAKGKLYRHKGNYSDYIEAKALREEMDAATEAKQRNRYRNELKWVRRGARARSTKQKARLGRFETLAEDVLTKERAMALELSVQSSRLGRKVIELEHVSKAFDDRIIVKDFSAILQKTDRIAIIGDNGTGKTTLLKMLAGEIQPDEGSIDIGQTVKIAHFHQQTPAMDSDERMINYIREVSNSIQGANGERFSATQMLEQFLFPSHAHGTPIRNLSGGEKKRLFLLRLLMEEPNVLLLDEPTNDLDIETLTVLEQFIDTFPGVVITVSHDRYFLDRTCTKVWALDGSGDVTIELGMYSDFLAQQVVQVTTKEPKVEKNERIRQETKKVRMSYHEKKEWETIEETIQQTEQAVEETEAALLQVGSDFEEAARLDEQLNELQAKLELLYERWEILSEIAEQM